MRHNLELKKVYPLRLFVCMLLVLFAIESVVMLLLPKLIPAESTIAFGAVIDACLLTAVLAPMLWYWIIKPLQNLALTRQWLLARNLSSHESERRRISLDLHDSLGQSLTVLTVGLRTIEESTTDPKLKEQIRELRRIGGDTHEEVRRLVRGLRPAMLDDLGLVPALDFYLNDLTRSKCILANLRVEGVLAIRPSVDIEIALYRIVQECATNAIRHGKASQLQVSVRFQNGRILMDVEDDGIGFDTSTAVNRCRENKTVGLMSIQERAWLLDGLISISSEGSVGTRVHIEIPISQTRTRDQRG